MLFRVMMTHYGPKDSETAIAYFVSAPSERSMIEGFDQKVMGGLWRGRAEDDDDDGDRRSIYMDPEGITDEMRTRIAALGLTLDERQFGADITGPYWSLLEYYHGDGFDEVDGDTAYYGATRYEWEEVPEVDHGVLRSLMGDRFIDLSEGVEVAS